MLFPSLRKGLLSIYCLFLMTVTDSGVAVFGGLTLPSSLTLLSISV